MNDKTKTRAQLIEELDELRQQKVKWDTWMSVVEHSNDAIFTKTSEGIITSWNRATEEIYSPLLDSALPAR